MAPRSCVVAGGSGLVGLQLLQVLGEAPECESVTALLRQPLSTPVPPKVQQTMVDFEQLAQAKDSLRVDAVFCALGTTRAKAGSPEAFRRVDLDYPRSLAQLSLEAGARQFLLVSAMSANARSSLLYSRTKGELEELVLAMPFPDGVKIVRPSLLMGHRPDRRTGEAVAQATLGKVRGLFAGPLMKYRPIDGRQVAEALWRAAAQKGNRVFEGHALFGLLGRS